MNVKDDITFKPEDKGAKELFSMVFYRPIANFILYKFLKNSKITPNSVSVLSLIVAAAASFLFFLHDYVYLVMGTILLNIAYVFDVLDGQLARYRNMASNFGRVFDAMLDVIKIILVFFGISLGIYTRIHNPLVLLLGLVALSNSFLTFYMMICKQVFLPADSFTAKFSSNIYIGYESTLYVILSLFALINKLHAGLFFLATCGALSWLSIFIVISREYQKRDVKK